MIGGVAGLGGDPDRGRVSVRVPIWLTLIRIELAVCRIDARRSRWDR